MDASTAKNNLLSDAYSPDNFRKDAQQMIELIAEELENLQIGKGRKTIDRKSLQSVQAFRKYHGTLDSFSQQRIYGTSSGSYPARNSLDQRADRLYE